MLKITKSMIIGLLIIQSIIVFTVAANNDVNSKKSAKSDATLDAAFTLDITPVAPKLQRPPGYTGNQQSTNSDFLTRDSIGTQFNIDDSVSHMDVSISHNYTADDHLFAYSKEVGGQKMVHTRVRNQTSGSFYGAANVLGQMDNSSPKAAYNPFLDQYLIAYGVDDVNVQVLDNRGVPISATVPINVAATTSGVQETLYNTHEEEYAVLFVDSANFIRFQRVAENGQLAAPVITLSQTVNGCADFTYNWIDNEYMVVGNNTVAGKGTDIWGQIIDKDGNVLESFVVETDDQEQLCPKITYNSIYNSYMVIWTDTVLGNYDVFGRQFDPDGDPLSSYISIEIGSANSRGSDIDFNWRSSNFLVAWDTDNSTQSYVQRLAVDGYPINSPILVASNLTGPAQVSMGASDSFVVAEQEGTAINGYSILADKAVFLPIIMNSARGCSTGNPFNETISWNMEKINALTAWQCDITGDKVRVAVLDTGADLDHPELESNIIINKTYVDGTSNANDDNGHGTHVAGIIAARANNGGIVGVAPTVDLMPVKVLDGNGSGAFSWTTSAIVWAVNAQADVINMSLGSIYPSQALQEALQFANDENVLVVTAAGNCGDQYYANNGCDIQDQANYPAAYSQAYAVASTDVDDQQSSFSNENSYVEITAPGSGILSTRAGGGYFLSSGTSMSAPHVAGAAALLMNHNPAATAKQVRAALNASATDLGSAGRDNKFGYGLIDINMALNELDSSRASEIEPFSAETVNYADLNPAAFVSNRIIVGLSDGVQARDILLGREASAVQVVELIPELDIAIMSVPEGDVLEWVNNLQTRSGVRFVEPDFIVSLID